MITPAYSPTATERVLPRMALDFTTGVLDSRVTVTRALNTATAINSSGFVAVVNANLPRFDYDPITLAPKGLLIEELRTNLLTYSEQFDDVNWAKVNSTVTANAGISPDGTTTADKLSVNTTNGQHNVSRISISGSGLTVTISVFAKAAELSWLALTDNAAFGAYFDLTNGVTGSSIGTIISKNITNFGNGWYRCAITATTTSPTSAIAVIATNANNVLSFAGANATDGILIWGADIEAGAFATSYIPTTTTSVTRNADAVTMTGTNFTDWFNASQGTLYAEGNTFNAGSRTPGLNPICLAGIYDGTVANRLLLTLVNNTATQIAGRFVAGGASQINGLGASFALGSVVKEAGSYISGNSAIYGNSVVSGTSAGAFTFAPNQLVVGAAPNAAGEYLCGWMRKVNFYNIALTQAQLAAITK